MPFSFPLNELADWLHANGYYQACNVPAFTTRRVCPVLNYQFESRFSSGRPIPLGSHSHPRRFLSTLSESALSLYRQFYLHQNVDGLRDWPGLTSQARALWQLAPLWTPAGNRYILSSIQGRSAGEFVYLGDDSGLLIEEAWSWLQGRGSGRALDLCCGCGVVGISLPDGFHEVIGVDANETAIELAQINRELNRPQLNAHFLVSDLFSEARGSFDFVIGNPPALPVSPDLLYAYGGANPADLTVRAAEQLPEVLNPGGKCLLLSFSVRDHLWNLLCQRLDPEMSLEYEPRRRLILKDPELGWMEHVWLRLVRDGRGRRQRRRMSFSNWACQWSLPWLEGEPPLQECYAGHQRSSRR